MRIKNFVFLFLSQKKLKQACKILDLIILISSFTIFIVKEKFLGITNPKIITNNLFKIINF